MLAKAVILVEGPSDELIVQRAYRDAHGRRPIEDGIDVINVRGLSARRFLDLAVPLKRRAAVITDNDGDHAKVDARYSAHTVHDFVSIHRGDDNALHTLEPQLLAANSLDLINRVLDKSFQTETEAVAYMTDSSNKTDVALAFHDTIEPLKMPPYIQEAVDGIVQ